MISCRVADSQKKPTIIQSDDMHPSLFSSPRSIIPYSTVARTDLSEPNHKYYLPIALNHPAFDAFVIQGAQIYCFQISVDATHSVNPKEFQELRNSLPVAPPSPGIGQRIFTRRKRSASGEWEWNFIAVIPKGQTVRLKIDQSWNTAPQWVKGMSRGVMQVDIEELILRERPIPSK
jgi:hypothetical protein